MDNDDEDGRPEGRRKDGKPFKAGNTRDDGSYGVGKNRTPVATRFAAGDGRKRGRRGKGVKGLKTVLAAELAAHQTVGINGKAVSGNRLELMVRVLASRAASGDFRSQALLIPLVVQALGIEDRGIGQEKLSEQDQALLDELLAGNAADPAIKTGGAAKSSNLDSKSDDPEGCNDAVE